MANEFKVKKGLIVQGSGSTVLDIQGSQGQLFSVTDSLSGSLFSVSDISGIPILEVFSDDRINLGTFGAEAIKISGSTANITGSITNAISASYLADGVVSGSSQITFSDISGVPSGLVSGSSQVILTSTNGYSIFSSSIATTTLNLSDRIGTLETSSISLNTYTSSIKTALEFTGSNVTVKGNLTVKGTTTTVDSTTVEIGDNIISLNGSGATNAGIIVRDATSPNLISGSLLWDTTTDKWIAGPVGSEDEIILSTKTQTLTNKIINGTSNTITNIGNSSLTNSSITIAGTPVSLGGSISSSTILSGSNVWSGSVQLPSGLVSGSSQITFSGISGIPSGLVSGSSQITISGTTGFGSYINQSLLTTSSPSFTNLTLGSNQVLHVGNYNNYAPTKTGTGASGTWGISITGSSATATNLANGSAGTIPYQTSAGTTAMLAAGTSGYFLKSNNTSAPSWVELSLTDLPDAWVKKSVKVATTTNITLSGTTTIDGVAVVAGDRVLVKNQTTTSQNGIYIVNSSTWTRSTDADTISKLAGTVVNVDSGTSNGGLKFITKLKTTDTLGTTAVNFYKITDETDLSGYVTTGTGTINYLTKFSDNGKISDSQIFEDGTYVRIKKQLITGYGLTNVDNFISIANTGVGYATGFRFDKANDGAGLSVTETVPDSTMYEFFMSDNPDGGDMMQMRFTDWQSQNTLIVPFWTSGKTNRFIANYHNFFGSISQNTNGVFTTSNLGETNGSQNQLQINQTSKLRIVGSSVNITDLNINDYTGNHNHPIWIKLDTTTTFAWGYGSHTGTAVQTNIPLSTSAITLSNGIKVTFSTTTGAVGDLFTFRAIGKPTNYFGTTNFDGNITATSFIKSGGNFEQFLKADGNVDNRSFAEAIYGTNTPINKTGTWMSMTEQSGITGWTHVINLDWEKNNTNKNWSAQIAVNAESGSGMYYRSSNGGENITNKSWKKLAESSDGIMSNNYYPYWNDTNKRFENGKIIGVNNTVYVNAVSPTTNSTFVVNGGTGTSEISIKTNTANPVLTFNRWTGVNEQYAKWYIGQGNFIENNSNFNAEDLVFARGASTSLDANPTKTPMFFIQGSGNVGIGITNRSASEKLDVNGYVKATGFKVDNGSPTQFLMANGSVNSNTYAKTDGTGATGTWSISITGNAATATTTTGNATTATTLQTARNINGTSFNGSADITTATWGTGRTITIGAKGKTVDGSGNVSWTLAEIGAQAALTNPITGTATSGQVAFFTGTTTQTGDTNLFWDNTNKRLGIGATSPQRALQVNAVNTPAIRLNNSNSNQGIEMLTQADKYSWLIGAQYNVNGGFEITPSTAVGGTTFTTPAMTILQTGNVGIGTTTPSPGHKLDVNGDTNINGTLTATVKSFIIDHPTKSNKKLQYGVLEGPEHSVYFRGKLKGTNKIILPDYWFALVNEETITVNITPIGDKQNIWIVSTNACEIILESETEINCFYTVFAERKDIDKLVTEFDK